MNFKQKAMISPRGTAGDGGGSDTVFDIRPYLLDNITFQAGGFTSLDKTFCGTQYVNQITIVNVAPDCKFNQTFAGCTSVTAVYVYGQIGQNGFDVSDCQLSSGQSINDGILSMLADKSSDTSGTKWVCKLGAKNLAKLTTTQKATAINKGWELE